MFTAILKLIMSLSSANMSAASASNDAESVQEENTTDYEIELITQQAEKTIVIHAGSSQLRIGRASDPQPILVPHVIAWRCKQSRDHGQVQILRNNFVISDYKMKSFCSLIGSPDEMLKKVQDKNKHKKTEILKEACLWTWTDTSLKPSFLIGDDALYTDENDCYTLFWPIVNGQLNITEKSLTAVVADLEACWTKAIENFLGISKNDICNFRCILVIPDIYERKHVTSVIDMLYMHMGFHSILVHQESVCATYGCGIANACVVDVGHQKTSISCVEDGFSHPDTRITIDVGGCDITSAFALFLKRGGFSYRNCNIKNRMDALLLQELKETYCHLDKSKKVEDEQEFTLRRPGQRSQLFSMALGCETMLSPMIMFYPEVFQSPTPHFWNKNPGDPNDPFDEIYLASTRTKQEEAWATKREKASKIDDKNDITDRLDNIDPRLGLDEMIVWSIERCPESYNDEVKRRMYNSILLVGGGLANFEKVESLLQEKVLLRKPQTNIPMDVNVITKPNGQDPGILAWKGGAVLSSLENAQELWITKSDWIKCGVRLLRENCAFLW